MSDSNSVEYSFEDSSCPNSLEYSHTKPKAVMPFAVSNSSNDLSSVCSALFRRHFKLIHGPIMEPIKIQVSPIGALIPSDAAKQSLNKVPQQIHKMHYFKARKDNSSISGELPKKVQQFLQDLPNIKVHNKERINRSGIHLNLIDQKLADQRKSQGNNYRRKCKSSQDSTPYWMIQQPEFDISKSNPFSGKLKSFTLDKWRRNHKEGKSVREKQKTIQGLIPELMQGFIAKAIMIR